MEVKVEKEFGKVGLGYTDYGRRNKGTRLK
jgi:hypothetical protein